MKIQDILKERRTLSFEVFPPKADKPMEPLEQTLAVLSEFRPDFISCTYGAGGTNKGRQSEVLRCIRGLNGPIPLAHYTCIGNSREDVRALVDEYRAMGIEAFLALRGDYPKGQTGTNGAFDYGCELIEFLRKEYPELTLAGGCYPEKHLNSRSMEQEYEIMKAKQSAGADFFMAQLCHDLDNFAAFREGAAKHGVTAPIVFGLMPILSKDALIRMTLSNGCSIPKELAEVIGKYGDDPEEFKKAGKEFTLRQIERLIREGVDGLHLYTLNKHEDVSEIVRAARL